MQKKFCLATLLIDGRATPSILMENRYFPFSTELEARFHSVKAVLEDWDEALPAIVGFVEAIELNARAFHQIAEADALLDIPVRFPNKLLATGGNYMDHLREMNLPLERFEPLPMFFMPPTTCMVGPGKTVRKPRMTKQFDWELELALVIGKRISDVDIKEAEAAIVGYTIALDMSARDLLKIDPPLYIDLVRGKAQDTMAPVGPVIVPSQFIKNPCDLAMVLRVNGQIMTESTTAEMMVPPAEIVSLMSQCVTLEPGDIVLTGSPAGSGVHHNYFLKAGDVIQADIAELGSLVVEIYE
jgi:2-keto-4-pentenoate hydratase/2-oxohepta-3-ene-1,7-dioic acid hydratase in catechol pathway